MLGPFGLIGLYNKYFGKQWRARWNAKKCGISSKTALFVKGDGNPDDYYVLYKRA